MSGMSPRERGNFINTMGPVYGLPQKMKCKGVRKRRAAAKMAKRSRQRNRR